MRRRAVGVGLVLIAALAIAWRCRSDSTRTPSSSASMTTQRATSTSGTKRIDPATLARGSIRGIVRDESQRPIAGARVCARGANDELDTELLREPTCAITDAGGRYQLAKLLPAHYRVGASAPTYRPASVPVRVARDPVTVALVLPGGGVELAGVVRDVTGGPIAGALVSSGGAFAETDADGAFALWVAPSRADVHARADGYVDRNASGDAPGTLDIVMTPEATLAGVVVDAASGEPVAGARVTAMFGDNGDVGALDEAPDDAFTDEHGRFRIVRMLPGRYAVSARTDRGYGRGDTTVEVGIGERVEGFVVKLHPAVRVEGIVVFADTREPCEEAAVSFRDAARARTVTTRSSPSGQLWADGVLPGTYEVDVACEGALERPSYPPIVVGDAAVTATAMVWEVDRGGAIEGRVTTRSGDAVAGAFVSATGGVPLDYDQMSSRSDGSFALAGLAPGTYELSAYNGMARSQRPIEVGRGTRVTCDVVLDDTGIITGVVVDARGVPVAERSLRVFAEDEQPVSGATTDLRGAFTIRGVLPGVYWLGRRGWERKHRVTVRANETATIRIVADEPTGVIHGVVTDPAGRPVQDAYIISSRENDGKAYGLRRSSTEADPVITNTEGAFTLTRLRDDAQYSILAYRQGGGEGVVEHVKADSRVTIRMKPTGTLTGVVRRAGKPVDELEIAVNELGDTVYGAFRRTERFFRTAGRFSLSGLPARRYRVTASAEGSQAVVDVELDGDTKTVSFDLDPLVTITGRVIAHPSGKPVADVSMFANRHATSRSFTNTVPAVTDTEGRFAIANAPRGMVQLTGWSERGSEVSVLRTVTGAGRIDIGDVHLIEYNEGDRGLGIRVAHIAPDTPLDRREVVIEAIEPDGPAANSPLRVGDVIVAIDGLDVTGGNAGQANYLAAGPAGSKATVKTKRGVVVELVR